MYTGIDFLGVIIAALMILGPMTLGATHASEGRQATLTQVR